MNKKMKYLKKYGKLAANEAWFTPPPPPPIEYNITKDVKSDVTKDTITLKQAMQLGSQTQFEINIGVARTSDHDVYYNMIDPKHNVQAIQGNLPPMEEAGVPVKDASGKTTYKKTRTLKGKESDLIKAAKEGKEALYYFKYITDDEAKQAGSKTRRNSLGTDITDFLKVGDKSVNEKGSLVIDFTDGKDEEIIASGNGLYLLLRTAANNQQQLKKGQNLIKKNVVEMRSVTGISADDVFNDTDFLKIKTNSDKTNFVKGHLYFLFQLSAPLDNDIVTKNTRSQEITPGLVGRNLSGDEVYKIKGRLHGQRMGIIKNGNFIPDALPYGYTSILDKAPQVGQQRDELIIDALQYHLFAMNDWYYPANAEKISEIIKNNFSDLEMISREDIQNYLNKFKEAKTKSERDAIIKEFIKEAMQDYKENFLNFVDSHSKEMGLTRDQIIGDFNIDASIQSTLNTINSLIDSGKNIDCIWDISSMTGVTGKNIPPPQKKISTGETDVKVGDTEYKKNEKFRILKTFEIFKFGRLK